jgi:hypothetical protein
MEYIICIGLGLYVGYKLATAAALLSMHKILQELNISPKQLEEILERMGHTVPTTNDTAADAPLPEVPIKIEKQGDMLYVFRKDNDKFLGQATTPEELIVRLGEKIRNVKLTVAREDGGELMGGKSWQFDTGTKEITKAE